MHQNIQIRNAIECVSQKQYFSLIRDNKYFLNGGKSRLLKNKTKQKKTVEKLDVH